MTSERWQQIEELYHLAREKGGEALAGADPEVRKEVERLLAQDSESGDKLLDQNAAELIAEPADAQVALGTQLGPYRIEALLGRGGMGRCIGRRIRASIGRWPSRFVSALFWIGFSRSRARLRRSATRTCARCTMLAPTI